jgi:single-stranded-DNA-specific exonuclease
MNCRWSLAPAQPLLAAELARNLKLSPLLAQCLLNRGLAEAGENAAQFLEPRLRNLSDPFLLPDMGHAVERLFRAREHNEPLVIFGDYDVDGVTSAALLTEALTHLGWTVHAYLPHRFDEGYGLSQEAVQNCLLKWPVPLLLAVDCGSTAVASIAWLAERGVDTIVLDHHQVASPAPAAVALINPHVGTEGASTFLELCSVGLAFKLAHALVKHGRQIGMPAASSFDLRTLLDLVALGTIADLVPLRGENRILVTAGLKRLNDTERPGLRALKEVAGVGGEIGVHEVGFQLAPRLNAAGRLENALQALQLLLARSDVEAQTLARALDAQNRERQQIERNIAQQVIGAVRAKFNPETDYVIVEGQLLWHLGVVGIVASRVLREFYRPTVIIGGSGEEWRGSGRSIEGFDLAAALRSCGDLLTRHGGHAAAAGLSLRPNNLDAFRIRLNEIARRTIDASALQPLLRIDSEAPLNTVGLAGVVELERLEPVGQGNPPVQLVARGLRHDRPPRRMGAEDKHAKMWVTDGRAVHEAVWWNCGKKPLPENTFDLAFAPEIHEYQDRQLVQLKVLDWKPSEAGPQTS